MIDNDPRRAYQDMARAMSLVIEFIGTILVFTGLGWLADRWLGGGGTGVYTLIGLGLGLVFGCYLFVRAAMRMGGPDHPNPRGPERIVSPETPEESDPGRGDPSGS